MDQFSTTFLGHKLKLARSFYGLSLEEVGEQVAASRQYIQQLEAKVKTPSSEMISALADVFKVEPKFFFTYEPALPTEEDCHFRSRQTKTLTVKNHALGQAALLESLVMELDEFLNFPDLNLPAETVENDSDVELAAQNLRKQWGLGDGPITNIIRAVERAGIIVGQFGPLSEKIDAFSKFGKRPIIVRNPAKESVCRMRFDIAHECGHLVMHQGQVTGDKQTEHEANRFASAFLFPRAAALAEFPRGSMFNWAAIYELKLKWKVSAAAIVRRGYDLGLIDAAAYRRASIHLSKTGQTKLEKYDDSTNHIPPESPEMLQTALGALLADNPEKLKLIRLRMSVKPEVIESLTNMSLPQELGDPSNIVPLRRN